MKKHPKTFFVVIVVFISIFVIKYLILPIHPSPLPYDVNDGCRVAIDTSICCSCPFFTTNATIEKSKDIYFYYEHSNYPVSEKCNYVDCEPCYIKPLVANKTIDGSCKVEKVEEGFGKIEFELLTDDIFSFPIVDSESFPITFASKELRYNIYPVVLQTNGSLPQCEKVDGISNYKRYSAYGELKLISLGDGSGSSPSNYSGYHFFTDFKTIDCVYSEDNETPLKTSFSK